MTTDNKEQLIRAELQYLGRPCWKTAGFNTIHTGLIREVRFSSSWLEVDVYWKTKNGKELNGHPHSWERVSNLGFEGLPQFNPQNRADLITGTPSNEPTPWSKTPSGEWEDCQGLPEEEDHITKTASTNTETHPHVRAPKRRDQSEEANRQVNYRALLALLDERKRDDWHVLQLNESLKREGCNTITLPAFIMRADKFQKSFERSIRKETIYNFLKIAFNGDWHGDVDKTSIWSQY